MHELAFFLGGIALGVSIMGLWLIPRIWELQQRISILTFDLERKGGDS
jgi:hypothetical protein